MAITNKGDHGFDPVKVPEMKAIFFAEGPDIRQGVKLGTFPNTALYPFIAKILGLNTPKIDGKSSTLSRIRAHHS